jgi:pimeloyl-ACP methyl ester carboxylesterase
MIRSKLGRRILFFYFCSIFLIILWKFSGFFPQKRVQLPYQNTIDFRGKKINYEETGSGKPVILLHGSLSANPWGEWDKILAQKYTVFTPHMPGYGASDSFGNELHNEELFANALCEFVRQKNLKEAPIISYSYGTVVALRMAAKNCTTGKLILVGVPAKLTGWKFEFTTKIPLFIKRYLASTQFGKETFIAPVVNENIGRKGVSKGLIENINQNDPKVSADVDVRQEVEIGVPKDLANTKNEKIYLYGENDGLRKSTKELIPNPIIIQGTGHNIFVGQPVKSFEVISSQMESNQ